MKQRKLIALIGAAGAGKDSLMLSALAQRPDLNKIISYTTRPPRDTEQDGVNYYFITREEFEDKIKNGLMLEYTVFNNWYYGAGIDALKEDAVNIGVFNPEGIRSILERDDIDLTVYLVFADAKLRLLRALNRENNPDVSEVCRRFLADETDFGKVDFEFYLLTNNDLSDFKRNTETILSSVG